MMSADGDNDAPTRPRLAIIGGGSSGLICLKSARELLPDWEVVCFERSAGIRGCWGNPPSGFVSTSTRYTTQFACYAPFPCTTDADSAKTRRDFFRDGEFGDYLEDFADAFSLRSHVRLETEVVALHPIADSTAWLLTITNHRDPKQAPEIQQFDQVIICTGLHEKARDLGCKAPLASRETLADPTRLATIRNKTVVVFGGGESAVDYANRLAAPALKNRVLLSLKSGIRVSPRYHPIRGVPSDFLRNRLLLSIHPAMRNSIGERFVRWRIRHQKLVERLFPKRSGGATQTVSDTVADRRAAWAFRLTQAAKDDLFNMFHNKSDDFLDAVAENRIEIVGPALDESCTRFRVFGGGDTIDAQPDLIVPAIGFESRLAELTKGLCCLSDFYLGCTHLRYSTLHLIGHARPIIGNIPTISEMQAAYVCGLIARKFDRPADIQARHQRDCAAREARFGAINLQQVYPVDMFPYCDRLAKHMDAFPRPTFGRLLAWCRLQLVPASTRHYHPSYAATPNDRVYMPLPLIVILLALTPLSCLFHLCKRDA